jgi:murein L,D-transpeptidase YafK
VALGAHSTRGRPAPTMSPGLAIDWILVDKSDRSMRLMSGGAVVRQYQVSLGSEPHGDKRREGDGRTPEGNYFLDWRNPKSRFHLSLHISYPDPSDELVAAREGVPPGGAIFIHGSPNWWPFDEFGPPGDWTEGCIAVTSAEIREIWSLAPDGTPIEIRP